MLTLPLASQYHAWPSAARGIAMLRAENSRVRVSKQGVKNSISLRANIASGGSCLLCYITIAMTIVILINVLCVKWVSIAVRCNDTI